MSHTEDVKGEMWDKFTFVLEQKLKLDRRRVHANGNQVTDVQLGKIISKYCKEMSLVKEGVFESSALFETIKSGTINFDVDDLRKQQENKFEEMNQLHLDAYNQARNDKDLKRALYFSLKDQKDILLKSYSKEVAKHFTDKWELNAELIIFQNIVNAKIDVFKKLFSKDVVVETNFYSSENLNRFKKCPCGQVWFKVYGCNSMRCGNRTKGKDVSNNSYYNYFFSFIGGKMVSTKTEAKKKNKRYFSRCRSLRINTRRAGRKQEKRRYCGVAN